jgi:hypothetical protein
MRQRPTTRLKTKGRVRHGMKELEEDGRRQRKTGEEGVKDLRSLF